MSTLPLACNSNFAQNDNSILKVSECSEENVGKSMKESLTEREHSIKQNVTKPLEITRAHFMNYCFTNPGKFSCTVDSFLELAFRIFKDPLKHPVK